jgi:STAS-like domain of unknown function (DUF4325)
LSTISRTVNLQAVSEQTTIRVFEVAGSNLCVAYCDGQKVRHAITAAIKAGKRAKLSFAKVESLTAAFLSAAIGQLYADFSEQKIRANLSVSALAPEDLALLKRVVETAEQYFQDPSRVKEIVGEALGE